MNNGLLKYCGVFGVLTLWSVTLFGMLSSGLGLLDTRPISYLGVAPDSATFFNGGLFTSAVLFLLFGLYLYRKFQPSRIFIALFVVGQIAQIIAAIFVYEGTFKLVHTVAAFTLAGAIPFHMKYFALSLQQGDIRQKALWLFKAENWFFIVGIGAFVFATGISPLAEILPALPFHAWIFYLTFSNMK